MTKRALVAAHQPRLSSLSPFSLLHFSNAPDEKVRFEGRTLILSELILFGLISLNALVFSQIEGWTYLDGE